MSRKESPPEPDAPLTDEEVQQLLTPFMQRVGARVRAIREAQGLTMTALQDEHGLNLSQSSRIENGKYNLTLWTAVRLGAALGVRPWQFYLPPDQDLPRPRRRRRSRPSDEALEKAAAKFRKHIGARVRELRQLQGMSQLALASFAGVPDYAVRNLEAGRVNIRASTAIRLADAIGVHPHELYIPTEQSGIRPHAGDAADHDD